MPPVKTTTKAALVHSARVLDVNIANWTLSVQTQFTKKPVTDIPFAVPYMHPNNGEGIYFMPEVGSTCWLCEPSDGSKAFVMAWTPPSVDGPGQFRAHRQDLNPGDIWMGTRDENFLVLRRGGVVQIGGNGLCQRMFLPINNTIKDFCENYGLHTLGGDLEWAIARTETTDDGTRPALLKLSARVFADDEKPTATLEIGSHEGDKKTILTLKIKKDGKDGSDTQISLKMSNEGTITWDIKKDVIYKIEGKLTADIKGEVTVKTEDKVTLEAKKKLSVKAKGVDIDADGDKVTIKSDLVASMTAKIGGATYPVVLATPSFIAFLNHMHPTAAPGPPSPGTPPCTDYEAKSLKSD
jgi:hypothetical protein